MLRNQGFISLLNESIKKKCYKSEVLVASTTALNERYGVPKGVLMQFMTLHTPLDEASDFLLYVLSTEYLSPATINQYFSSEEVKRYSNSKYEIETIKFPLELPMIQVNSSQWIGVTSVQQLMNLRNARIINYNENTQRTLQRVIINNRDTYRIAINNVAVETIQHSFEAGTYIPNTITLNMADDSEADYEYDEVAHILRIKSIKYFDIIDGYHRYLAISRIWNTNKDFDYPMELRIEAFSETKAKQFIFQEDQKTKMSKMTSDSYNQSDYAVYISERIAGNLAGGILSRNQGVIDLAAFVLALKFFYNTGKIKNVAEANALSKEIEKKIDALIDEEPEMFEHPWKKQFVYCAVCVLSQRTKDYAKEIHRLYELSMQKDEAMYIWIGNFSARKATALVKLLNRKS